MDDTTPTSPPATVRDRMIASGMSPARIDDHFAAGTIELEGVGIVTDLDQPAPWPSRWRLVSR